MKYIFLTLFFVVAAIPCTAQWTSIELGAQITAYGVKDSFLFMAVGNNHIYRYTVANGYSYADNGIDFTQGSVTSFASLGTYLFAGIAGRPSFRSTDNGSNWTATGVASPIFSNGAYIFAYGGTGIYRSRDNGNTWGNVVDNIAVNNFAAFGIYVYAATSNSLWRSTDTGNNWTELSPPPALGTMTTMDSLLFIVGSGKLIVSSDKGGSWNTITVDSGTVPETVTNLATDGKNLFITGQNSVTHYGNGVYLSTDVGKTWQCENQGLGFLNVLSLGVFDTLLFVNASANINNYTAMRSIPEMTDTAPASVVHALPSGDSIEVYPNPAAGIVNVVSGGTSILGVSVLNVLGEDVLDLPNLRESDITLDISKLPSGTYFFLIKTDNGSTTRRVVVTH